MLHNKVALITGAASGLGRAVALRCAREGSSVLVADADAAGARATAALVLTAGARVLAVGGDAARPGDMQHLVERCCAHFGRLDLACNHAGDGVARTERHGIGAGGGAQDDVDSSFVGLFYGMRYQIEAMRRTGGGAVVNMVRLSQAREGTPGILPAHPSVAQELAELTRRVARDNAGKGIRINTLSSCSPHPDQAGEASPQTVADFVVWLLSAQAAFVTGAVYALERGQPLPHALATAIRRDR